MAEFVVNNKIHSATKMLLFMANYGYELRIRANIRRKSRKSNKVCRENNEGSDKSKSSIEKNTREMKRQVDKKRKEAKV